MGGLPGPGSPDLEQSAPSDRPYCCLDEQHGVETMTQRRSLEDYLPGDLTIDDFVTQGANRTYFDRREALAYLLLKRHVVPISCPSQHPRNLTRKRKCVKQLGGRALWSTPAIFSPGVTPLHEHFRSDGETDSELYELLKFTLENPKWGSVKWACVRWQDAAASAHRA